MKPWLFVTFNIIVNKPCLLWKFPWCFSNRSKDMKNFSFNINYFHWFLGFFWHFSVAKKLIKPIYNRWCQHFFTFILLEIDCLIIVKSYTNIRLVALEIKKNSNLPSPNKKELPSKSPALLGLNKNITKWSFLYRFPYDFLTAENRHDRLESDENVDLN